LAFALLLPFFLVSASLPLSPPEIKARVLLPDNFYFLSTDGFCTTSFAAEVDSVTFLLKPSKDLSANSVFSLTKGLFDFLGDLLTDYSILSFNSLVFLSISLCS
jgi:hypothetical protein